MLLCSHRKIIVDVLTREPRADFLLAAGLNTSMRDVADKIRDDHCTKQNVPHASLIRMDQGKETAIAELTIGDQ